MTNSPVQTKRDLARRLFEKETALRGLGVERLALFGSFLIDEQGTDSDVDFLVEFQAGMKNFDRFMALALLLEEILQRRVELVAPEALSPFLGPRILREVEDVLLAA